MVLYRRDSECCLSEFDSCLCFPFWIWLFPKYDTTCYRRDLECCRVEMCPCLPLRICLVPMCDMAVCVCVVIWLFVCVWWYGCLPHTSNVGSTTFERSPSLFLIWLFTCMIWFFTAETSNVVEPTCVATMYTTYRSLLQKSPTKETLFCRSDL